MGTLTRAKRSVINRRPAVRWPPLQKLESVSQASNLFDHKLPLYKHGPIKSPVVSSIRFERVLEPQRSVYRRRREANMWTAFFRVKNGDQVAKQ